MKIKKKKKHILDNVLRYLKSDTYLFAPLVSRQRPTLSSTSTEVDAYEPVMEKNQKLVERLMDYLDSDYHLYGPLVDHQPSLNLNKGLNCQYEKANMNGVKEVFKKVTDEKNVPKHRKKVFATDNMRLDGYPRGKPRRVEHTLLRKETLKHIVQQNRRVSLRGPTVKNAVEPEKA